MSAVYVDLIPTCSVTCHSVLLTSHCTMDAAYNLVCKASSALCVGMALGQFWTSAVKQRLCLLGLRACSPGSRAPQATTRTGVGTRI